MDGRNAPDLEEEMVSSTGRGAWPSAAGRKLVAYTPLNSARLSIAAGMAAASRDAMFTCGSKNVNHALLTSVTSNTMRCSPGSEGRHSCTGDKCRKQ